MTRCNSPRGDKHPVDDVAGPDAKSAGMSTTPTTARTRASTIAAAAPWWTNEQAVRLSDLPRLLPPTPTGERTSLASVYRWTTRGLRGCRLRRFKIGGGWCTTTEELNRWSVMQTEAAA